MLPLNCECVVVILFISDVLAFVIAFHSRYAKLSQKVSVFPVNKTRGYFRE